MPLIPTLPPPPEPHGITASAPLNVGLGATVAAGSNALTTAQFGVDVTGVAFAVNLAFQEIKKWEWFDQHRWWPITLLLLGVGLFLLMSQGDWTQAIPKGATAAVQAAINYGSQKATGLGIFEPAADPT